MKLKTQYQCQNCAYITAKWMGKCPDCGSWNSLVEEIIQSTKGGKTKTSIAPVGQSKIRPLSEIAHKSDKSETSRRLGQRISTGISELDRVLGGGLVPDSFVLIGGDPGIGKSTLLLQMAKGISETSTNIKILYFSGEESVEQIQDRARRLGVHQNLESIFVASETVLETALHSAEEIDPDIIIFDSLQTFISSDLESAPGSVSQVREIAAKLMHFAKSKRKSVWLVGHVTKEGSIAGPKTVEHMVDTVLYFEGDGNHQYRMLRAVKNRFGSSRELGLFEMEGEGLREVSNPSELFLNDRDSDVPGVAIGASLEGSRTLLVELQALVTDSVLAIPRRTAVGMDSNRMALLAAIMERHMRIRLAQKDLFFNVAGGLRIQEPACDLAAIAAIGSSMESIAFPRTWIFMGEVGLTGEIRSVNFLESRVDEALKLGFKTIVLPKRLPGNLKEKMSSKKGCRLHLLDHVSELRALFPSS